MKKTILSNGDCFEESVEVACAIQTGFCEMDNEQFLRLFQGPFASTNDTLHQVDQWDPNVSTQLFRFIDAVHAAGFDIYQTDNLDYRIGKKDLRNARGNVVGVLSFKANRPVFRSILVPTRPLDDLHLQQFNNRSDAILVNRGAGAAELFNLAGRQPHWPNEYINPGPDNVAGGRDPVPPRPREPSKVTKMNSSLLKTIAKKTFEEAKNIEVVTETGEPKTASTEQATANGSKIINDILHVMYFHCTGNSEINKETFITELRDLLNNTKLKERTIDELWHLSWDKPVYARQKADTAKKVIQRCKANGFFQNSSSVPTDSDVLSGLQQPTEKLRRIQGLAEKFQNIYDAYCLALAKVTSMRSPDTSVNSSMPDRDLDSIRNLIGVKPSADRNTIFGVMNAIRGYGGITELHTLMDYGFPVCKPDIWVVRFVIAYKLASLAGSDLFKEYFASKYPSVALEGLEQNDLDRHPKYAFCLIDFFIAKELDFDDPFFIDHQIDIKEVFVAHRLTDILVAKFGMMPESVMGIITRPLDLFDPRSPKKRDDLIADYPELSKIAVEFRKFKFNDD